MFTRVYHVNLIGETFTAVFLMFPNLQHLIFKTSRMKLCEAKYVYGQSQWLCGLRFKVCGCSPAEIVGLNPTKGMGVCLLSEVSATG